MPKGDAYIPLSKYLKESNGELIKLSFQEIETILQKKLPKSAYKHSQPWWSNDYSHSQAIAWLEEQKAIDVLDEEEREFADNVDSYRKEIDAAYQKGYNEGVRVTLEKQGEPLNELK